MVRYDFETNSRGNRQGAEASYEPFRCMEIRGGNGVVEESVRTPGLELALFSRPHAASHSGGDVHFVSTCGGGVITRLILADVSGHGLPASEIASSLRGMMRRSINTKSQRRLVRELNQAFSRLQESGRFATAVVATYLASTRRLTLSNAGHPRPFWYCQARGEWSVLEASESVADDLPLGLDADSNYGEVELELSAGDLILLYTDAVTEAADGEGHLLGETGLKAILQNVPGEPKLLVQALLDGIQRHRHGEVADDDITLMVLRADGTGIRRLSTLEKIEVYAKVLRLRAF